MYNTLISSWSTSEVEDLLELKNKYKSITSTMLAEKLNLIYGNGRTGKSVSKKLYSLKRIIYDEEMDTVIIKHIREYPTNLQYAFGLAAIELNTRFAHRLTTKLDKSNISGRYYAVIRKKYEIITTGSAKGFTVNVKNSYILKNPKKVNSRPRQHLKPVLWLMKEILKLSDKERQQLIDFLVDTQ